MTGPETRAPLMSVVLVTPGGLEPVRATLACLRAQTVRERLEVVLVGPGLTPSSADAAALEQLGSTVLVETGGPTTTAAGLAAGVRRSTAPLVAFTEEHSAPQPEWAERLIAAHDGPWAVVGPAIVLLNPETRTGRADYVLAFGRWAPQAPPGPAAELPGHNSAYKREVLLSLGPELEPALAVETVLHWRLRSEGARLLFEPAARTGHLLASSFRRWLRVRFERGRILAARRGSAFSPARRALYVAGSPLIPLVRLGRLTRELPRGASWRDYGLGVLAVATVGAVLEAAGEAAGYARGAGTAERRLSEYELRRRAFLARDDPRRQP